MSIKQVLQFAAVVCQNLPEMSGEAMQRHIDNPKGLQEILRKAFAIFKTIKLGTGLKSADDFRQALKKSGMKLGDWASDLLNQSAFKVSSKLIEVDLVTLTVAELGFEGGASYSDVCKRGVELGHDLCQPEHGPQLRLQYKDQPKGEVLYLAMEAIRDSDGDLNTFAVERLGSGLWLSASYASPGGFCSAGHRFVFACRK
ncbi:MAG: hypothetical protein Q8O32_01055 [bacterium]|nr:hypothetical protein [bacterium]